MKKRVLILGIAIFVLLSNQLLCSDFDKSKLPQILNSSLGTEFYFSFLPCWETTGYEGGLRIYVVSNKNTNVIVEVKGKGFKEVKNIKPYEITKFNIDANVGLPYRRTPFEPPETDSIYSGAAIHITSDSPILCYAMTRYKYSSDAFFVLPVKKLGKEYIIATAPDVSTNQGQWLPAMFTVTATEDKTKVQFEMGGNDHSRTAGGQFPPGQTQWNLNAGDVLTVASLGNHADLTGSIISSTKPVAVVSGSYNAYIPTTSGCASILEEMALPTNYWGTEYFVPKIENRLKSPIIKIFAKEPKTNIYRNSQLLGMILTSGGVDNSGYFVMRSDSNEVRPVIIEGDKPINVIFFNPGQLDDQTNSDPFMMSIVPTELFQTEATFLNFGINEAFSNNYISIFYEANEFNIIPDDFEIATLQNNKFVWEKLSDISANPGEKIPDTNQARNYYHKTLKLTNDGVYKLRAKNKFQVYSYGMHLSDSYGHPAFVGDCEFDNIPNDTIPPSVKSSIQDCGIIYGIVYDSTNRKGFNSNLSTIYLHSNKTYNYNFYPDDFMPCEDSSANWWLERINKNEDAFATITFMDCAGNDTTMFFEYADSNQFYIKSPKQEFEKVTPGIEVKEDFYVYNKSDEFSASIKSIKFKSTDTIQSKNNFQLLDAYDNPDFSLPVSIPKRDSVKFSLVFKTDELVSLKDTIVWSEDCGIEISTFISADSKTGIVKTTDIDFGETNITESHFLDLTIKNDGNDNLEIYDIILPTIKGIIDNNEYNIFSSDEIESLNISQNNPVVIQPGLTKKYKIIFRPDSAREYLDSIIIKSNSIGNLFEPDSVSTVKGKGVKPISVEENDLGNIGIYPNPAADVINIENLPPLCNRIIIFNNEGKKVREIDLKGNDIILKISTKDFSQGAYNIRFFIDNKIIDNKFVIAK